MKQPTIRVEGLRELRRDIRRLEDVDMAKALREANRKGAELVATKAAPKVRSRTGRLRASVKALGSQNAGQVKAGNARVPYAATYHWGRKKGNVGSPPGNHKGPNPVKGDPFLFDTLDECRPQIIDEYQRQIDDILRGVGSRG